MAIDSSGPEATPKDRPFDPSKLPASPSIRALIDEVESLIARHETRVRRRKGADQKIHRAAISALVADLVHRHVDSPGAWLSVELSKKCLGAKARRAPFMTEAFAQLVHAMARSGVIELDLGFRAAFAKWRTRIRAAPWLMTAIDEAELGYPDVGRDPDLLGDPLVLKAGGQGAEDVRLELPMGAGVDRLRREMREINRWLAGVSLSWEGDDPLVDTGQRFLRRVFNEGRLDRGGRLFGGFWLNLPSQKRLESLRIEGRRIASVDFAQMAVRLAYAKVGAPAPPGDLYAHRWHPREGVKLMLTALLSASAPFRRMPRGGRSHFRRGVSVDDLVAELGRLHPAISHLFFRGNATELMFLESQVTVAALLALKSRGVVALPVHDCVLVAEDCVGEASEVLMRCSEEVTGVCIPVSVSGGVGSVVVSTG